MRRKFGSYFVRDDFYIEPETLDEFKDKCEKKDFERSKVIRAFIYMWLNGSISVDVTYPLIDEITKQRRGDNLRERQNQKHPKA